MRAGSARGDGAESESGGVDGWDEEQVAGSVGRGSEEGCEGKQRSASRRAVRSPINRGLTRIGMAVGYGLARSDRHEMLGKLRACRSLDLVDSDLERKGKVSRGSVSAPKANSHPRHLLPIQLLLARNVSRTRLGELRRSLHKAGKLLLARLFGHRRRGR